MTTRQRRMLFVGLIVVAVALAATFTLKAFKENMLYYVTPTELAQAAASPDKTYRLGGMVKQGSVKRADGSMLVQLVVTDFTHELPVAYTGVLPDLFREGQGVIARGKIVGGALQAEEVLAKHDENYMPPEIAEKLKSEHGGKLPGAPKQ
jgi:cytochrome c-type biogenesis protein CcmE